MALNYALNPSVLFLDKQGFGLRVYRETHPCNRHSQNPVLRVLGMRFCLKGRLRGDVTVSGLLAFGDSEFTRARPEAPTYST